MPLSQNTVDFELSSGLTYQTQPWKALHNAPIYHQFIISATAKLRILDETPILRFRPFPLLAKQAVLKIRAVVEHPFRVIKR